MRERASALLYIVAAAALCGSSLVAVQRVRASNVERMRAAEQAKRESERAHNALRELDAIMCELDAIDAAIQQAVEELQTTQSTTERVDRSQRVCRLQRQAAEAMRRADDEAEDLVVLGTFDRPRLLLEEIARVTHAASAYRDALGAGLGP